MLAIVAIVVVLVVSGLAFYAMRSKRGLTVSASLLKLASFSIEVEPQGGCREARCRRGCLCRLHRKDLHKVPGVGGICSQGILRSASRTLSVPAAERLLSDAADLTAEECAAVFSSLVQSIASAGHESGSPR